VHVLAGANGEQQSSQQKDTGSSIQNMEKQLKETREYSEYKFLGTVKKLLELRKEFVDKQADRRKMLPLLARQPG